MTAASPFLFGWRKPPAQNEPLVHLSESVIVSCCKTRATKFKTVISFASVFSSIWIMVIMKWMEDEISWGVCGNNSTDLMTSQDTRPHYICYIDMGSLLSIPTELYKYIYSNSLAIFKRIYKTKLHCTRSLWSSWSEALAGTGVGQV